MNNIVDTSSRWLLIAALAAPSAVWAQATPPVPKAALVQDVNEPGRAPYFETGIFNQTANNCPNDFYCVWTFAAVPAGKRLVVTFISADFTVLNGTIGRLSIASDGNAFGKRATLPGTQSYAGHTAAGGPVTFYVDAGSRPTVVLSGHGMQVGNTAIASVGGHFVSVP